MTAPGRVQVEEMVRTRSERQGDIWKMKGLGGCEKNREKGAGWIGPMGEISFFDRAV